MGQILLLNIPVPRVKLVGGGRIGMSKTFVITVSFEDEEIAVEFEKEIKKVLKKYSSRYEVDVRIQSEEIWD